MSNPIIESGESEFSDRRFQAVELRDEVIADKLFQDCVFEDCAFAQARFVRCRFSDCVFERCDLSNMAVSGCSLRDVRFESSKMVGINWTQAASVSHLDFIDCVLNYSNFVGLDLRKSLLEKCMAREVDFAQANLSETDCRGTDFTASRFSNTNLTKTDFRNAINYNIRPTDNKLKKTRFSLPEATSLLYGLDIVLEE